VHDVFAEYSTHAHHSGNACAAMTDEEFEMMRKRQELIESQVIQTAAIDIMAHIHAFRRARY
jgi:hypothetical protein